MNSPAAHESPSPEFVREFTRRQRPLYFFIFAQLGRTADAEEVLQETNIVALRKHDQFTLGTNMLAWLCQIAQFEVQRFRQHARRDRRCFSQDLIDTMVPLAGAASEEWDVRRAALSLCLEKLRDKDRELIEARYAVSETTATDDEAGRTLAKELADRLGRPANSVYQSIGRIRKTLAECVRRQLAAES